LKGPNASPESAIHRQHELDGRPVETRFQRLFIPQLQGLRSGIVLFSVPSIPRWVLPFGSLDSLAIGAALGWCGASLPSTRGGWPTAILSFAMLGWLAQEKSATDSIFITCSSAFSRTVDFPILLVG
jgi:hypothetical protein